MDHSLPVHFSVLQWPYPILCHHQNNSTLGNINSQSLYLPIQVSPLTQSDGLKPLQFFRGVLSPLVKSFTQKISCQLSLASSEVITNLLCSSQAPHNQVKLSVQLLSYSLLLFNSYLSRTYYVLGTVDTVAQLC